MKKPPVIPFKGGGRHPEVEYSEVGDEVLETAAHSI